MKLVLENGRKTAPARAEESRLEGEAHTLGSAGSLPGTSKPGQRLGALVLSGAFLFLLWLPLADSLLNLDHSPIPIENRSPATFPTWMPGIGGIKQYLSGLESYFKDHFGFRKLLIRAHGYLERGLFREGSSEVLVGRDHWLYYVGNRALDYHLGMQVLSEEKLKAWQHIFEARQTWCSQRGIKYLLVLPPNKESIYPEFLPEWASKTGAITELDQFLAHMRTHSSVSILDLRPALLEAKKSQRSYQLTDTHWNYFGAFAAYRAIIASVGAQLPGLEPVALERFALDYTNMPGGDLARMLAQEQTLPEPNFITMSPLPPLRPMELHYDMSLLPGKWLPDEQPAFTENAEGRYKAVMFRDSFASFLTPFLGYDFKRIVFIWQRPWEVSVIEHERPDVVIDEMLERYLDWPLPAR